MFDGKMKEEHQIVFFKGKPWLFSLYIGYEILPSYII